MPNVAGLTILLGADFTSAEQAMDAFNGKVSQFVNQMQALFAAAGVNVQNFQKNLVSLTQTQEQLTNALKAGNEEIRKLGDTTIKINDYTRQLTNGIGTLGYTMTRTIHGFAELFVRPGQALLILANDIPQVATRLRELSQEQKALAAAGQPALSTTQLLAAAFDPWVIAMQIGITALIRGVPYLYKWATGADAAAEAAKELTAEQNKLKSIQDSAASSTGAQIATVKTLEDTMTNANLPLKDRYQAYDQFAKLYPSYLEHVSRDAALTGGLAKIIDNELVPALVRMGQANAGEELLKEYDTQLYKINKQIQDTKKASQAALNSKDLYSDKDVYNTYMAGREDVPDSYVNKLKKQFSDVNNEAFGMLASIRDIMGKTPKLNIDGTDVAAKGLKNVKEHTDKLARSENDLQASLKEAAAQLKGGTISEFDAATQNLQAYQKNLTSLFKNGGAQSAIDKDIQKIKELNTTLSDQHWKDVLGKQSDYFNNQSILVQVGGETQIQALQNDLSKAKQTLTDMVTGDYALDINSDKVKAAQQEIADLQQQIDTLTRNTKIADVFGGLNNQTTALKQELQANLISPLQYAKQDADNVNAAVKKLQSLGVGASGSWIQNLQQRKGNDNALVKQFEDAQKQEKIFSNQFESSVQEWNRIIDQPIKTFIDDLVEGKNVAKDFGKAVIKVFEEIGAKLLESGIISMFTDGSESAKALSKQTGKPNFENVWDFLSGGDKAIQNSIERYQKQQSGILTSMFGNDTGWLFGNNTEAAPQSSDYGQPNYDKSKAIGDDAMKQLSVLDNATINNTIVGGKTKSTESSVLSTLGSIASLIPGWGLASGLLKGFSSVIPYLADGGVVTSPTLAMIGEAGKEAVIPLDKLNQFTGNTKNLNVNVKGVATGRDLSIVGTNYDEFAGR